MYNNLIEWPEEFSANDSDAWRSIEEYDKRMEMIAFHAGLNLALIAEGE